MVSEVRAYAKYSVQVAMLHISGIRNLSHNYENVELMMWAKAQDR